MKRINIALTDEQHERMFRYLDINWSHVARAAFESVMDRADRLRDALVTMEVNGETVRVYRDDDIIVLHTLDGDTLRIDRENMRKLMKDTET